MRIRFPLKFLGLEKCETIEGGNSWNLRNIGKMGIKERVWFPKSKDEQEYGNHRRPFLLFFKKMRPCPGRNLHSLSTKMKNAAMPRAEPALLVRKNEKCGHVKGRTHSPCPQKWKMRPRQGQTPHSLSAKPKNAATPRADPALPVRNVGKPVSVLLLCLLQIIPLLFRTK